MTATKTETAVTINEEQRLFVIPCGKGYTCLGFDVCKERSDKLAGWLAGRVSIRIVPKEELTGTMEAYNRYTELTRLASEVCREANERCPVELTPELVGLEGKRVEVVDRYGEKRRFIVGKSMGWMPIHLEIAKRTSSGGPAVMGTPFKSVKVVG